MKSIPLKSTQRNGGCLCGTVRFEARVTGGEIDVCHCDACRKTTGGAPWLGVPLNKADVVFTGSENIRTFRSSDWAERGFCKTCGTNLFFRLAGDATSDFMSLCPGAMDDMNGFSLGTEMFTDEQPDSYVFPGCQKSMTGAQAKEMLDAFLAQSVNAGESND